MEVQGCACPIYIQAWCDMMAERDRAKTENEKLHVYAKFAKKYTMLPHYWSKFWNAVNESNREEFSGWFNYIGDGNEFEAKHVEYKEMEARALIFSLSHPAFRKFSLERAESFLNFPHGFLNEIYEAYCVSFPRPVSKEITMRYHKNKELYARMKECEENIDEWLKCLDEIDDPEAVMANFELKLGQGGNWTIKKIWDAYFKVLKENGQEKILEVYRKYTRLFINDKQAVEEYREEIEKYSMWNKSVTNFWIDTIKWEMDFGDLEFAYVLLKRATKAVLGKNVRLFRGDKKKLEEYVKFYEEEIRNMEVASLHLFVPIALKRQKEEMAAKEKKPIFYVNNSVKQVLPFRQSFIQHLLKTANGQVLKKLYSTCKLFFSRQPAPLCYRLEIAEHFQNEIWEEIVSINENGVEMSALENLYTYGSLVVQHVANQNFLSTVISKLYRCDASIIQMRKHNITYSDYKFLLSKNITEVYLYDVTVNDSHENAVNGRHLLRLAKTYPKMVFFEAVNDQHFIIFSSLQKYKLSETLWNWSFIDNSFETIHIEGQQLSINTFFDLLTIADKNDDILLDHVVITDNDGNHMEQKAVDDIVRLHHPIIYMRVVPVSNSKYYLIAFIPVRIAGISTGDR